MKCTLMTGIESISGSVKSKNGSRIVFKTFSKPSTNQSAKTETRVYLQPKKQRSTPVTDAEIKQRNLFALASEYWKKIPTEDKKSYHDEWKRSKYLFNGKPYATLRGYVMARFMAEHK